jgi:hypothetical protein
MANYVAFVRSNYFAVQDQTAFEQFCREYDLEPIKNDHLVGFLGNEEGGIPSTKYDEKSGFVEADFFGDLAAQLKPGWVAVVQEVGFENEKMRYLVGRAIAVNADGESVELSLDDIYESARHLGHRPITACEY